MKFTSFVSLFFAGTVLAESSVSTPVERSISLVERDFPNISSALSSIQIKTFTLESALDAFNTSTQIPFLQTLSDTVLNTLISANSKIALCSSLTLAEAIQVGEQADILTVHINAAVDSAIDKKSTFVAAGARSGVKMAFDDLMKAVALLGDTIVSKVPSAEQSIGREKAQTVNDALKRGVEAFADQALRMARAFQA